MHCKLISSTPLDKAIRPSKKKKGKIPCNK